MGYPAGMEPMTALAPRSAASLAERFGSVRRLSVRQRKRWLEILFSFEMKNAYDVYDEAQRPVLRVQEQGRGFWSLIKRLFLGPVRPFMATVSDLGTQETLLELHRPFRWIFQRLDVRTPDGQPVGAIQKRWSWIRRIYHIEDASGQVVAELFGPILRPWTFEIRIGGQPLGHIRKKWSGLAKELFTDADNFAVELGDIPDPTLKTLAFAATVLVDVVHFERAKG
jgi:uncharacterized protein YxjI